MNEEKLFRDLKKSSIDKKIAGVCGGLGEYTPLASWMWRVIFLVSIFICGFGVLTYLALWICMPSAPPTWRQEKIINPEVK